jgi:hypothetical protein
MNTLESNVPDLKHGAGFAADVACAKQNREWF